MEEKFIMFRSIRRKKDFLRFEAVRIMKKTYIILPFSAMYKVNIFFKWHDNPWETIKNIPKVVH